MQRLLRELQLRGIDLDEPARDAIEDEFLGRLGRSPKPDKVLEGWNQNVGRYVELLDAIARQHRKENGFADRALVILNAPQVKRSFATCGQLCPGPT